MSEEITAPMGGEPIHNPTLEEEAAAMDLENSGQPVEEIQAEARPEWLPEKFKSPDEMAKAYAELESKMSNPESKEEEAPSNETVEEKAANDVAFSEDLNRFDSEYAEKGSLSDETYEEIAKKYNAPKEIVDQIIRDRQIAAQYQQQGLQNEVHSSVGGEEAYNEMAAWAKDNASDSELEAYNSLLESGNVGAIKMAAQGLHAKYKAAMGPDLKAGSTKSTSSSGRYESYDQFMSDLNDPRYGSGDPAFHAKVQAKLKNSPNI